MPRALVVATLVAFACVTLANGQIPSIGSSVGSNDILQSLLQGLLRILRFVTAWHVHGEQQCHVC